MLGEVIGVEAAPIIGLDQPQPLLILATEREISLIHMIEDAELHRRH